MHQIYYNYFFDVHVSCMNSFLVICRRAPLKTNKIISFNEHNTLNTKCLNFELLDKMGVFRDALI